jgi:uncharacterized membrane protein
MAPLSEHEKKQLRLMEEQLHKDDPKFVKYMRSMRTGFVWHRRPHKHNVLFNVTGLILGASISSVGVFASNLALFILGFILVLVAYYRMRVSVYWARKGARIQTPRMPRNKTKSAFMARLEYQWDERKKNEL